MDKYDFQSSRGAGVRVLMVLCLLLPTLTTPACDGDGGADRSLDAARNKTSAGAGGTMNPHITPGSAGSGGAGGTLASAGSTSSDAGAGGDAGASDPPGPTDDGLSPYSVYCDDSTPCSDPAAVSCLHVLLDEGTRSTCSNDCRTTADCSDAPSGAPARAQCVQFTSAKHCVLVCYDAGAEVACPDGMGCYRYLDSPVGYCLWP